MGVPIKWMCVEGTKDEGMLNVVTALIRACSKHTLSKVLYYTVLKYTVLHT